MESRQRDELRLARWICCQYSSDCSKQTGWSSDVPQAENYARRLIMGMRTRDMLAVCQRRPQLVVPTDGRYGDAESGHA